LRRLRRSGQPRILWVDAICINQSDLVEKSHQVSFMGEIYSKTTQCLIWLGEEPSTPEHATTTEQAAKTAELANAADALIAGIISQFPHIDFSEVKPLPDILHPVTADELLEGDAFRIVPTAPCTWHGDERDQTQLERATCGELPGDPVFHAFCLLRMLAEDRHLHGIPYLKEEPQGEETYLTDARRALHWITHRPWWTRIWTVQECVLPKYCVLMYGPVQMPWLTVLDGVSNLLRHRNSCCALVADIQESFNLEHVEELQTLRHKYHVMDQKISLEHLLRQFRHREATNPRDKVYGLLGLVNDWGVEQPLVPDYEKDSTLEAAFCRVVIEIIKASGSLDILCQPTQAMQPIHPMQTVQSDDSGKLENVKDGFPSWIPDFSTIMAPGRFTDTQKSAFEYWGDVAKAECDDEKNYQDRLWRTLCGDSMRQTDTPCGLIPEFNMRFRRALVQDEVAFRRWCFVNGLTKLARSAPEALDHDMSTAAQNVGAINHAIGITTKGRRFFITRHNHMGIGPARLIRTLPDPDEIYVLEGGRTPFALRRVGQKEVPSLGARDCHELLGDCYLEGFMDGEGWADSENSSQMVYIV